MLIYVISQSETIILIHEKKLICAGVCRYMGTLALQSLTWVTCHVY